MPIDLDHIAQIRHVATLDLCHNNYIIYNIWPYLSLTIAVHLLWQWLYTVHLHWLYKVNMKYKPSFNDNERHPRAYVRLRLMQQTAPSIIGTTALWLLNMVQDQRSQDSLAAKHIYLYIHAMPSIMPRTFRWGLRKTNMQALKMI